MPDKSLKILDLTIKIELDYFYQLKANKIFLNPLSRDGYLILTRKDFPFLKIKAHEVRALSFSWAFFDKVPLNEILKAAV